MTQVTHLLLDSNGWAVVFGLSVQLVLFVRWIYRRIRDDEITRSFVEDMAMNHLPYIYEALRLICERQGIDQPPLPPIRWIDLGPYAPRKP
jgi:hypothetical protein